MQNAETKWCSSQLTKPEQFRVEYDSWCRRVRPPPTGDLIADVHETNRSLNWTYTAEMYAHTGYMLARHWGVFVAADVYPLWLHANDIPTMQAARDNDPALEAYLRDRARTWSSTYISCDLSVNVWAARVCLDLYGIKTPLDAYRPRARPRGEIGYVHDPVRIKALLDRGLTMREIATELAVSERFLRENWKNLGISPAFGKAMNQPTANHAEWLAALREGMRWGDRVDAPIHSVSEAAACWGMSANAARKRLFLLGWEPFTSVQTLFSDQEGEP